ncbi:flavoprotein [Micromonospora echinofusca]|uniref:flavoprotein n=1 Tax=Micromonospora echinofusca TaxID=47858 RepID=UPI0033DB7C53
MSVTLPFERVLVAACGSSGAMSLPQSLLAMRHALHLEVRVVMTGAAATFVTPTALAAITGHPVTVEEAQGQPGVPHLDLTEWAQLVLVLPATANTLAKAAAGMADNLVTACVLASAAPVVFVPAMNVRMWEKPAVQRNVAQLRADGHGVVPPSRVLALSSGTATGIGVPGIETVLEWTVAHLASAAPDA